MLGVGVLIGVFLGMVSHIVLKEPRIKNEYHVCLTNTNTQSFLLEFSQNSF